MATILFITMSDLKRNTILDGNVDVDKLLPYIKIAQEIDIRNYLGTDLYNKITNEISAGTLTGDYLTLVNSFVQPMLIHYGLVNYLPFAAYTIKNGGIYKHTSENSETASKEEIAYLVEKERDIAEYYTRRFVEYMNFNQSSFPEYTSNTNDDIHPQHDSNYQGWVL